jgi:hypothetical protein
MSTSCLQHCWECTSASVQDFAKIMVQTASEAYRSIESFFLEHTPQFYEAAEKIQKIIVPILQTIGVGILLASQSSMFAIGILVSIMNPKMIENSIRRISIIWEKQNVFTRAIIVAAATVAWPISLAASAFFVAGNLGVIMVAEDAEASSV